MFEHLLSSTGMAVQNRCAALISLFFAVGMSVTFAERLAANALYAEGGLMSWRVLSFDRAGNGALFRQPEFARLLFGRSGASAGHVLGLAGTLLVALSPLRSYPFTAGLAMAVLSAMLVHLRSTYAGDGAQQMNLVVGVALLLGFNPWVTPATGAVCLLFISAQSALSYLASGAAKLISPIWMGGDALRRILATTAFGSELGFRLASFHPGLTRFLCRATVILEAVFPLMLAGPKWLVIVFLAWGAAFHLANAILMGLNTFFWAYLTTYPALYFAWLFLHPHAR